MKGLIIAGAIMILAASAAAQDQVSQPAILYSKGHFEGAQLTVWGPWQHITPEFTARSIKIPDGSNWEFCSGNSFTGCKEFGQSVPATVITVRSARPVASAIVSTPANGPVAAAGAVATNIPDQSLKGLASQYFIAPRQNGRRIAVWPGTAEAMRRAANGFCGTFGWRMSVYSRLQKVGTVYYLADVLCADSGG